MNMYLCAEISNCLLFNVLLHYASINDFTRIDKIKTVKGFEKKCFLLEFTSNSNK